MTDPTPELSAGLADSQNPADAAYEMPTWLRGIICALALLLFISAVSMIGAGLKTVAEDPAGKDFLHWLFSFIDDPITGLFIGVLVTALVQSSSFTTTMVITFVAVGDISLVHAIPIIMGANIGTSITGLLVSMGHVRRREEFGRSIAAASCHDFFNLLCVILFLPLEVKFGIISRPVGAIADRLERMGSEAGPASESASTLMGQIMAWVAGVGHFLKTGIAAMSMLFKWFFMTVCHLDLIPTGTVVAILAMVLLFVALWLMVKMLRGLMAGRLSGVFNKALFRNPATAFMVGIVLTAAVQSSSVTVSMIVPLVGTDILQLAQVYPYLLGANIGTTMTAMLAALSTGHPAAIACACGHLLFNAYGTAIFWPLKALPITMAKTFGEIAARRRLVAVAYILVLFFLLPATVLLILKWTGNL